MPTADCFCFNCNNDESRGLNNPTLRQMITCPDCGYKRCPRATDHRLACTSSNEPGQDGSRYGGRPAFDDAVAFSRTAHRDGRHEGIIEERERLIGCLEELIGRPISDRGQYRADILSALESWRARSVQPVQALADRRGEVLREMLRQIEDNINLNTSSAPD